MARRTLYGTVIVTYRCNARCNMCDCFKDPTRPEEEITLEDIKKLPEMAFTNITGGEPFIRQDIPETRPPSNRTRSSPFVARFASNVCPHPDLFCRLPCPS